jgi:hypothetical protein
MYCRIEMKASEGAEHPSHARLTHPTSERMNQAAGGTESPSPSRLRNNTKSTDGRWETASARPRVGKEHTGSVTAVQNKRIAMMSSRSSHRVRCCSCFAGEWLRGYPLGRAFVSRGAVCGRWRRAPVWRRILHAFLVHLTKVKLKLV